MEKKKVVDFPVERTESVDSFCAWPLLKPKEVFDSVPIKEIREKCLQRIDPEWEDNVNWFIKKIKAYSRIDDYETVCMLLRTFCRHQGSQKQIILDLMVDSIRSGMKDSLGCAHNNIKDILVILCGKLQHEGNLYNENTRKLFQEIIEMFYNRSVHCADDRYYRLVSRVLFVVMTVKDDSFISILERKNINKNELAHLARYASVCKERIGLEGLKMIVLRHLKGE